MIEDFFIEKTFVLINELNHVKSIEKKFLENSFVVVNDDNGNYKGILSAVDLIKKPRYIVGDCISKRPEINQNEILDKVLNIFNINPYNEFPVFKKGNFIGVICKKKIINSLKINALIKKIEKPNLNSLDTTLKQKQLHKLEFKLLSIISHDLRSPFNLLFGYTSYINDNFEHLNKKELQTYLSIINKAAQNNYNYTQQLLSWSLKQQKGITFNKELCSLNEIVEKSINILLPLANQKNITIQKDFILGEKINDYLDKDIVFNVLNNIISNAIKFSKEKSCVVVKTYADEKFIYIETKDNGLGMDEEVLHLLNKNTDSNDFTFFRSNGDYHGGFGLTYAKELVSMYGGELLFDSVKDQGTTVLLCLPLNTPF